MNTHWRRVVAAGIPAMMEQADQVGAVVKMQMAQKYVRNVGRPLARLHQPLKRTRSVVNQHDVAATSTYNSTKRVSAPATDCRCEQRDFHIEYAAAARAMAPASGISSTPQHSRITSLHCCRVRCRRPARETWFRDRRRSSAAPACPAHARRGAPGCGRPSAG